MSRIQTANEDRGVVNHRLCACGVALPAAITIMGILIHGSTASPPRFASMFYGSCASSRSSGQVRMTLILETSDTVEQFSAALTLSTVKYRAAPFAKLHGVPPDCLAAQIQ
jgi:hypothetical protein